MSPPTPLRLALVLLLTVASLANAQSSEYQKILNQPCAHQEVLAYLNADKDPGYVPISLLEGFLPTSSTGGDLSHADLPGWVVEDFMKEINALRANPTSRCALRAHGSADCDNPIHSIDGVVTRKPVVFLATIEHLDPVWSTFHRRISTVEYLRVTEILRDSSNQLSVGDLVTHLRPWGSVGLAGVTLCTYPPEGLTSSQSLEGQQVLVAGAYDLRNKDNIITATDFVFRVQNGQVLPPSAETSNCFNPSPFSLEMLREILSQ